MTRIISDLDLVLTVGNTSPIQIAIVMPDGVAETLADVDRASFEFRKSSKSPAYFTRSTVTGNLSVDVANSLLVATVSADEADDWAPGSYVGQAAIRRGSVSTWERTEPFNVYILPGFAPKV